MVSESFRKFLESKLTPDERGHSECIGRAWKAESDLVPGPVVADFYFLAAAYAAAAKDRAVVLYAIEQINRLSPGYDPGQRFDWELMSLKECPAGPQKDCLESIMDRFAREHPGFSLKDALWEYIPRA